MAPPADDPTPGKSAHAGDDEMARYLANVQLDALDLGAIDLDARSPAPPWALGLYAVLLIGNAIGMALLPGTATWQLHSYGSAVLVLQMIGEIGVGGLLFRDLQRRLAAQYRTPAGARIDGKEATIVGPLPSDEALGLDEDPGAAGAVDWRRAGQDVMGALAPYLRALGAAVDTHRRGLLLGAIVLLIGLLAFALPHEAQWSNGTYSVLWFLTVGIAAGTGILVGRFIMAAGESAPAITGPLPPLTLPPWMRWVNLALLTIGALTATFGPGITNATGPSDDFAFAVIGLITGVSGAIWLARRFDEWEAGFKQQAQAKQTARQTTDSEGGP